jgi:hypothetical protein
MRSVGLSGQARLDAGENVVLIDLLRFEDDPQDLMAMPGALRADPGKVRHRTRIVMPEVMDLVLYCESKNSFVKCACGSNPGAGRRVDRVESSWFSSRYRYYRACRAYCRNEGDSVSS